MLASGSEITKSAGNLGMVNMQGSGCQGMSRDSAILDASTHFGAFHDTDKGQMPRVPVHLEALSKPCKVKVRSSSASAGDVRVRKLNVLEILSESCRSVEIE